MHIFFFLLYFQEVKQRRNIPVKKKGNDFALTDTKFYLKFSKKKKRKTGSKYVLISNSVYAYIVCFSDL